MKEKITNIDSEIDVDKIMDESNKQLQIKPKEIVVNKDTIASVNNRDKSIITLGDLGKYPKVTEKEINMLFDGMEGVIIKLNNCLFRICYSQLTKRKFTCELINEEVVSQSVPTGK